MAIEFPGIQLLQGVYLGLLAGIIPALVAFGFGFGFKYVTGLSIPGFGVVVLALAIAGVNGGLLAYNDPTLLTQPNAAMLLTAVTVVLMLSFYAHGQGDKLGGTLPKHLSLRGLRDRRFSGDVVEFVGGLREVRVSIVGNVGDMEGYPQMSEDVRSRIREAEWTFPADLPLTEVERRFEDRLRSDFDLADAHVTIDERARATVVAAPPMSGVSRRVPRDRRAVSINALVPTGVARGDEVTVLLDEPISGTVVSAKSGGKAEKPEKGEGENANPGAVTDGGTEAKTPPPTAPTTTGGRGRVTVAVARADADRLLAAVDAPVVVRSRGTRREFELVSLLRRSGQRIRRLTLAADGPLADTTIGEVNVHDTYGVAVLAVRHDGSWVVAPRGSAALAAGDDVFVAGSRDALNAFEEAVA
ncbi:potassium channel family protein [Halocalculus aciditolerans]|uniref:RCK C-terminal domain-containing protein n=1 Tax=Halocalculus aciditolerans TaxID=1383812 RepID=A0A830F3I9_9EURY|nr:TrkA C-terminal domain-containing protein [Halocalculus aciditolerans]GGL51568.1 hypothetical protein GCM10009039_07320 [Halocalculus aciditolerans]